MPTVGRRSFLVSGLAAATAGCSRAHPSATQPVTEFIVAAPDLDLAKLPATQGLTAAQRWSALTAARSAVWSPVLHIFNGTHSGLRATFGSFGVDPRADPQRGSNAIAYNLNPAVSCLAGWPLGRLGGGASVDLSPQIRNANLDAASLLPGSLAATTDRNGAVRGIPIAYNLLAMTYNRQTLRAADLSPPPSSGWSVDQFRAAVASIDGAGSRATVFGQQLATYGGDPQAWFGFAQGYGGNVFGSRVVLASGPVYDGLKVYAGILKNTWAALEPSAGPLPTASLGFLSWPPSMNIPPGERKASPQLGLARFPRLPVPVVPAEASVARVPAEAPKAAAGATFAVWLATSAGQAALSAIGYPPMRVDLAKNTSTTTAAKRTVRPVNFRFRPGGIFGRVLGAAARPTDYGFDPRIVLALLQPEPVRLARLKSLEQALTGVLNGSMTRKQAAAMLDRQGVTAK